MPKRPARRRPAHPPRSAHRPPSKPAARRPPRPSGPPPRRAAVLIALVLNSVLGNPQWGWPVFAEW
ncbi:hypothetical protein, partial [Burkholderia mallei]|uniref:hypothetical protein n=1 Tax=Burkholderia mallei TaxID=13373 RepID=UPI001C4F72DC